MNSAKITMFGGLLAVAMIGGLGVEQAKADT